MKYAFFCLLCVALPLFAADVKELEGALATLGKPKVKATGCPCSPTCGFCSPSCHCGCADGGPCTCAGWAFRFKTYAEWRANAAAKRRRGVSVVFPPVAMPYRSPMMFAPSFGGGFAGTACRGGG